MDKTFLVHVIYISFFYFRFKTTPTPALDCGDKAAAWICKALQKEGLRLNFSAPSLAKRLSRTVYKAWKTEVGQDDEVSNPAL